MRWSVREWSLEAFLAVVVHKKTQFRERSEGEGSKREKGVVVPPARFSACHGFCWQVGR